MASCDVFRGFEVVDDCLHVDGQSLLSIAENVGTPFYLYSRKLLSQRVAELRAALPAQISIHYSVKANPMAAVIAHLSALVDGFDVASLGELEAVLRNTTTPGPLGLGFAGPGKSPAELRRSMDAAALIHLESETEMERVDEIARSRNGKARVTIRVNPAMRFQGAGVRMAGGPSPFGVDAERVPAMVNELARRNGIDFVGFHYFIGSQNLRAEIIENAQRELIELTYELAAKAPCDIKFLSLGGGFGVPYSTTDKPLDLSRIGKAMESWLPTLSTRLPNIKVVIELGRYLVAEAGIYVCRVVDRKISRGRTFLVTDGGLHHHLAATGNFGQFIRRNYPLEIGNRIVGDAREYATVVGSLCTPLDVLGDQVNVATCCIGDLVVIFQSGAYGLTASPTGFLSRAAPAEILA